MIISPKAALTFASLAIVLASSPLAAQDVERMQEVIEQEANSGVFMGSVLVAKDGQVLLDDGWGMADLEWSIENTPLTKFRIGSVTKQFTAVAILLLQEEGKLDLDDPIGDHLAPAPEAWNGITIRHLLQHTSGIPNVTALDDFGTFKFLPTTQEELIGKFDQLPLEFEPGSQWKYSNSGYVLLSAIVAKVSERPYADFIKAELLDPLDMKETGIDSSATILPKRAAGYSPIQDGVINAEYVNMDIPTGAGALYSTTGDLLKWQRGLFGGKVISAESLAEYVAPGAYDAFGNDKYGLGILIEDDEDGKAYWHGGGIEGFNSWLGYDPENKVTVAVLANLNGGTASKLGQGLMTIARGDDIVLPNEREETPVSDVDLAQYEGVYALAPTFKITIFQDDEKLMAQATGQPAFEIFQESPDNFFLKVVDAQIRFERDDADAITSLTLFQNGAETPGIKE
ncbi:MAG: serine hydrolase [Pseudomonadota bacterium]